MDVSASERQPNILLLLADDLGYNDSALYQEVYQQTPVSSMPALESLAEEGVRFSRFYTESTCSASRVALLTGQYPARQGFIPVGRGISPDVVTLPEYLQSQGYATHHVGKWHAGEINREAFPAAQGFDTSFGFLSQWMLQGPDAQGRPQLKSPTYHNPWLLDEKGNLQQYQGHLEDLLTAHTVQQIQQHTDKPWFIYHASLAPHTPLQPVERFAEKFPATPAGKHLAMLAQLDDTFAQIFSALKTSGQWDNTIIIVASDNGSLANHGNSNAPFAGGKAAYDEGGIRAPLVIKWHAALSRNKQLRTDSVSIMDIYASLRSLPGGASSTAMLDGRAVLLRGVDMKKVSSLEAFYTFDALSFFNSSGNQRLIREWDGGKFTRSDLLHYDKNALISEPPFWERWFAKERRDEEKLFQQFLDWRNQIRQVPLQAEWDERGGAYQIVGSDFQRSPVNPAWAVALAFTVPEHGRQVLLSQGDFLEVVLEKNRLRATVNGLSVSAGIKADGRCHLMVLSGEFYDRYSNVREQILPSRLHLILDGVVQDMAEATIESLAEVDISTPHLARGISPPRFFTTQLLPASQPISSGWDTELSGLCSP